MDIAGVYTIPLHYNTDDRGSLIELARAIEAHPLGYSVVHKFGQMYLGKTPTRLTIRAYHKHFNQDEWFTIIRGAAKFILVDDRPDKSSYTYKRAFVLSEEEPSLLVVPRGVYHGYQALTDSVWNLAITSEPYNPHNPDEKRVPYDTFGDVWGIKPH